MASNLEEYLESRIAAVTENVVRGAAKDYAAYREMVGEIRGYERVLAEIAEIRRANSIEDDDDDDDAGDKI